MKKSLLGMLIWVCLGAVWTGCSKPDPDPDPGTLPLPPPDIASPRITEYDWMSIDRWNEMHAEDVAAARQGIADLVFLGDSITESWTWDGGYREVFAQYFSAYRSVNFGIGGDQTQNLLWRLQNGLEGELDPAAVVVIIGVNNFNHSDHSASEVHRGVQAVIAQTRLNYPNARILLHAILPYEESARSPNRVRLQDANRLISRLADDKRVFFYDFGDIFLDDEGNIPRHLMEDFLHPSAEGMALFAQKIEPIIARWIEAARQE